MRSLVLSVAVLVGSGCATVSSATRVESPRLREVPAQTEVREYEITGSSEPELRLQMDQTGPKDPASGVRYDAFTHWYVKWSYPFVQGASGCATGPVTITLTVSMDLPRWLDADSGPDALKARWQEFLDGLVVHEAGHRENAVQAAAEIERALPLLAPHATCDEMDKIANEEGQKVLAKFRQADVDYDAKTDHGATQGARFP